MMVHEWEQKRVSQMSYDAKGSVSRVKSLVIPQKKFPKGHPHYFHFPLKTGGFQKGLPVFKS